MPKKQVQEPPAADNKPSNEAEAEDPPVVKTLKELDDKYCAIEAEYEREVHQLRKKFKEDNAHMLEERSKLLSDASSCPADDKAFATPACKGFWLQALQNSDLADPIQDWDEDVLQYLDDIKTSDIDAVYEKKGTKLEFFFKENPFFSNKSLTITVLYDYDPASYKAWMPLECKEIASSPIDWKDGKNVTVEITQKKVKGGGAKKAKQKGKATETPRQSFFRMMFCNLKVGEPVPESLACCMDPDEDDEEESVKEMLCVLSEFCETIDEGMTKYAVRFYTGEAGDRDDDDFSEDGEEESQDDDDEASDESEDEAPARGRGGKPKGGKQVKGDGAAGQKQEECKQQ